jgi:hypothetical protein
MSNTLLQHRQNVDTMHARESQRRRKQTTAMKGNTMNSNEIRSAIKRSETHSDIVRVAADCTVGQLQSMLSDPLVRHLLEIECDWDMCEIEDNKVDVWGWTDDTPEGKQDWRIIVQCQPTTV